MLTELKSELTQGVVALEPQGCAVHSQPTMWFKNSSITGPDQDRPRHQLAVQTLTLFAVSAPQLLALAVLAYGSGVAYGVQINHLWCLWAGGVGALYFALVMRGKGYLYGLRGSTAMFYGSTLAIVTSFAPSLGIGWGAAIGLTACCFSVAGIMVLVGERIGILKLARYLPSPIASGLLAGIGFSIMGNQLLQLWELHQSTRSGVWAYGAIVMAIFFVFMLWKHWCPQHPHLMVILPACWLIHVVSAQVAGAELPSFTVQNAQLLPPFFGSDFVAWLQATRLNANPQWVALGTALAAQATFLAFTLLLNAVTDAQAWEASTGEQHQLNREVQLSALAFLVMPWLGLPPATSSLSLSKTIQNYGALVPFWTNALLGSLLLLLIGVMAWGVPDVPMLFLTVTLLYMGAMLIAPTMFKRPPASPVARELFYQSWFIAIVYVVGGGILALFAGFAIAVAQFVRGAEEQVVHSATDLRTRRSRKWRVAAQEDVIVQHADKAAIMALQGSANFAVATKIHEEVMRLVEAKNLQIIIIDAQRVVQWDITAMHSLHRMHLSLQAQGIACAYAHLPDQVAQGFAGEGALFDDTDHALEWAEDTLLTRHSDPALLHPEVTRITRNTDLFAQLDLSDAQTLADAGVVRALQKEEILFQLGDQDTFLYIVLSGSVSLQVPREMGMRALRIATFSPGMVFGEMAFLDYAPRSATALVQEAGKVFCISRDAFDTWAQLRSDAARTVLQTLVLQLSMRMRSTTTQLIEQS